MKQELCFLSRGAGNDAGLWSPYALCLLEAGEGGQGIGEGLGKYKETGKEEGLLPSTEVKD